MARKLAMIAMALALGACSLNVVGGGSASGAMPVDDDGLDEDEGTSGASEDEGTTSGMGGTGMSSVTAPADDTADGPAADEGPGSHASLTISHGPVFDFGPRNLTDNAEQALTVTNEGDADATDVQVGGVLAPFSIQSHDCGSTLAPGAACSVQVRFDPDLFGDAQTELQIAFHDQGAPMMASRQLVGRGVGVTGNLIINGDGESGSASDIPPMGWTIGYGPSWSANWPLAAPHDGARTISAGWGPPGINQFTLNQQVDVGALTTWGDAEGVRFYYRAFHRSETEGNDPTWVVLRFRNGGGGEISAFPSGMFSSPTWNESVGNALAPPDTRYIQLGLECDRVANTWCSGFFDDIEVWAEWLG